jgi:hypothetical protein
MTLDTIRADARGYRKPATRLTLKGGRSVVAFDYVLVKE